MDPKKIPPQMMEYLHAMREAARQGFEKSNAELDLKWNGQRYTDGVTEKAWGEFQKGWIEGAAKATAERLHKEGFEPPDDL